VPGLKKEKNQEIFKSKTEMKQERELSYQKYKRFFIRVRFPDKIELQGEFGPYETLESLFKFVEDSMRDTMGNDWYLYTAPPMEKLDRKSTKNFIKLGFVPAILVHFGHPEGSICSSPYLNETLSQQIKEKVVVDSTLVPHAQPGQNQTVNRERPQQRPAEKDTGEKKQPAWLKLGEKK